MVSLDVTRVVVVWLSMCLCVCCTGRRWTGKLPFNLRFEVTTYAFACNYKYQERLCISLRGEFHEKFRFALKRGGKERKNRMGKKSAYVVCLLPVTLLLVTFDGC